MPHIKVVTDSSCDIPDSLLRQFDITVVPLSIAWGDEVYPDKGGVGTTPLLQRLAKGQAPDVLPPDIDDFSRVYRSLRDSCDGIISIHVSGKLSETLSNAGIAREAFSPVGHGGPFPIAVVDSLSLGMGLGWLVLSIARAASSGLELSKLVSLTTRLRGQTHVAFITDQLGGLLKSGAASSLKSQAGTLGSLKPLFHVDEGQISIYERTRTRAKARDSLYNFVEDFPKIGEIAIFHVDAQNDLEHLMTRVGAIYPRDRVLIMQPGAAVTAWLGPEALGVAVFEGEE
jgi:fatty acid kinase fatty acid binding subunit